MTDNKIQWEKWVDPFSAVTSEDDEKYPGYVEEVDEPNKVKYKQPIIVGPWGIIPITELNRPSKSFNFWIGHTNFIIKQSVKDVIEKVTGVETLDVFSPYRMRIAIGKSFDADEVKHNIDSAISKEHGKAGGSSNFSEYLNSLKEQLKKTDSNNGESKN